MAEEIWYYEKDGEQKGPVSREELQALIASGEISRENLAWRPGEAEWNETGSFEVLIPSFQQPPPPPEHAPPPPPPPVPDTSDSSANRPAVASSPAGLIASPAKKVGKAGKSAKKSGLFGAILAFLVTIWKKLPKGPLKFVLNVALFLWRHFTDSVSKPVQQFLAIATAIAISSTTIYIVVPNWGSGNGDGDGKDAKDKDVVVVETNLHGTRVPVGYTGPVGQIAIDASPWAEVLDLSSTERGSLAIPGSRATPLVLLVPPGTYTVDLGSERCEIEVAREESRTCYRTIRTVDAARYYQEVGW